MTRTTPEIQMVLAYLARAQMVFEPIKIEVKPQKNTTRITDQSMPRNHNQKETQKTNQNNKANKQTNNQAEHKNRSKTTNKQEKQHRIRRDMLKSIFNKIAKMQMHSAKNVSHAAIIIENWTYTKNHKQEQETTKTKQENNPNKQETRAEKEAKTSKLINLQEVR